jgi:hypothetical protein
MNLDWMKNERVGLLRRRVVPPTGFGAQQLSFPASGQPSQFPFLGANQVDGVEDFSGEALLILFYFSICS